MTLDEQNNLRNTAGNLWEAMTHMSACASGRQGNAYYELQKRLGQKACMSYQEIGIDIHADGWLITINACNEDGKVQILVPEDRNQPTQILTDTRATSLPYER